MKQIGNLAAVVANKNECLLQIFNGEAIVHTGTGNERQTMYCSVFDDEKINEIIEHLNFGRKEKVN